MLFFSMSIAITGCSGNSKKSNINTPNVSARETVVSINKTPGIEKKINKEKRSERSSVHHKRSTTDSVVNVTSFGAVGDGVTDNTDAFKKFFAALNGKIGFIPSGVFKTGILKVGNLSNCELRGNGKNSIILTDQDYGLLNLSDVNNVTFTGLSFKNKFVNNQLEYSKALISCFQHNMQGLKITNCYFTMPGCNATAISFLVRWTTKNSNGNGGSLKNISIENCVFNDIGQSAIAIGNRDMSTEKFNYAQNIHINNNSFKRLGLCRSYGFAVTFDGVGNNVSFNYNNLQDLYGIGIENTGFNDASFIGNSFSGFQAGRQWFPMSFSTRQMKHNVIQGNICKEPSNGGINFNGVDSSVFKDNVFITSGENWINLKDSNDNNLENNSFTTSGKHTVLIESTNLKTATRNNFKNCKFINRINAGKQIDFVGNGSNNNKILR